VTDLTLLAPELVLVGMALALLVIARRVKRVQSIAALVVVAAVGSVLEARPPPSEAQSLAMVSRGFSNFSLLRIWR
jgi:hypothetical protein